MYRIGHGYDVHQLVEGRKLIVGGVELPYERGLLGHSDADVLVHAACDAILGASRLGDLGRLFPDSNPAFEGADSLKLLSAVMEKVRCLGFELEDLDCTLAAQAPKMAPYRDQMRANIAQAAGVDVQNVGVKATTTEHLGFVGQGKGMAAWAVALLRTSEK